MKVMERCRRGEREAFSEEASNRYEDTYPRKCAQQGTKRQQRRRKPEVLVGEHGLPVA